jgi:hypothetical protein
MTPTAGDRYTRPGETDCVVTSVSCDTVTYAKGKNTVTVPLSQFIELAKQTLAKGATFIPMSTSHPVMNILFGSRKQSNIK